MKSGAAIVTVGDELLAGRVVDGNAHLLSVELRAAGFPVRSRRTVGDDPAAIGEAVRAAFAEAAVVVVTGGLGPTRDDLTREGVARAFDLALRRDPEAEAILRATYAALRRPMHAGSEVQADVPDGFRAVPNARGTAPGLVRADAEGVVFVAPGVPSELEGLLRSFLLPLLGTRPERGPRPELRCVTLAGVPEVVVGRAVEDLMTRGRDPSVGSYPKGGRVVLALESEAPDAEERRRRLDADVATIRARLADAFAADEDLPLPTIVVRLLRERGLTIAVAESLTGGLVADGIVSVPGASATFLAGISAYANAAKTALLGVRPATLEAEGAVSEACALEMAAGARRATGADVALATTGIAGPDGGTAEKPVGTTWLAVEDAAGAAALRHVFLGDRETIRRHARERAFDLLRRRILGLPLRSPRADA